MKKSNIYIFFIISLIFGILLIAKYSNEEEYPNNPSVASPERSKAVTKAELEAISALLSSLNYEDKGLLLCTESYAEDNTIIHRKYLSKDFLIRFEKICDQFQIYKVKYFSLPEGLFSHIFPYQPTENRCSEPEVIYQTESVLLSSRGVSIRQRICDYNNPGHEGGDYVTYELIKEFDQWRIDDISYLTDSGSEGDKKDTYGSAKAYIDKKISENSVQQ